MNNKKTIILTVVAIFILATISVGLTYAFFRAQGGATVTKNVNITTHTVDTLTFSVSDNISIEATQQNFTELDSNLSDEATTTAILTPNSKTGSASKNYYMYLLLTNNGTVYSSANTNNDPELLLQVFDGSNQLVTLTGLGTQKTIDSLTGYDITGKVGLYALLSNYAITASINQVTTENWRVVITLINHNFDQFENTGKQIVGSIIVRETAATYCDLVPNDNMCNISLTYDPKDNVIELENGYLYHHNDTLTNGANDNSWRYAGVDPNNYVCFGSDASTCPADNIYRIIGIIPVDVVTDETDQDNIVTEKQTLYKLIKNDYETSTSLGMTANNNAEKTSTFNGPTGNQPNGNVDGFFWKGTFTNNYNTWSLSTLNTTGLNTNAYGSFTSVWQSKIAKVMWVVGGYGWSTLSDTYPISLVYSREILTPFLGGYSNDNKINLANKIGLMYISDFGYASPQNLWTTRIRYFNNAIENNWLYKGVMTATITRNSDNRTSVFSIDADGSFSNRGVSGNSFGIRRVFYLTEDTEIDMSNNAGTLADPYRIDLG